MISTDAHSQTATHVLNLPEILRPGYTGQIDQPESVNAECTDPQVHQNDQFSDGVEMEYTDVGPTEDRSDLGVSGSNGNKGTMQDVINIFKPVCSNKGEVLEVKGGEEGDVKDEEEGDAPNDSGWFPLGPLISVLMAGYLHKILSRAQYLKVCTLMELCGTKIRKWTAIWLVPIFFYKHLDKMYAKCVKPQHEGSPHQPGFKLKIPPNLQYNSSRLRSIDCEQFELNYFEICLWGDKPISSVCKKLWVGEKGNYSAIDLPNEWRKKSDGRIIRHVPIALYCDDTSGNQSKKWNKHISYYFTLAGLPPRVSNQQYNCHFLSTSNTAGPLELADQIVDELNDITKDGYFAYDCELQQEVLVSTVVLCFLGDSPMHAEVTNTPLPGAALNPCRICHLGVEKRSDKSGEDYIYQFLGMDSLGNRDVVDYRKWSETVERSHKLWETALKYSKDAYIEESKSLGVQDVLNKAFVDILKSRKKKSELAKIMALDKHQNHKLFNPFLRLL
ncbi:hypothetical protein PTTG_29796, partial [Puccinia triticina 1-1 BBBD Race 1]